VFVQITELISVENCDTLLKSKCTRMALTYQILLVKKLQADEIQDACYHSVQTVILSGVLYVGESWSLMLTEVHRQGS
jgi:hypothetical protein